MKVSFLSIFPLFCFLTLLNVARAELEIDDVDGTYTLIDGVDRCPEKLKFALPENKVINGTDVEADGEACKGGDIVLSSTTGTSDFAVYLLANEEKYEEFVLGRADIGVNCSKTFNITGNEDIVFFTPEDDTPLDFGDVYKDGIPNNLPNSYELKEDARYLVIGDRCFYSSEGVCFPKSASVRLSDGSSKTMDQIATGDVVRSDTDGTMSPVIAWTHKGEAIRTRFIKASTRLGNLVATSGHYVFTASQDRTNLVRMKDLSVGMKLIHESGAHVPIVSLSKFTESGVWNPQTQSGSIVVDGFVASCYTEAVEPRTSHALLAPVRAVTSVGMSKIWNVAASFLTAGRVSA